MGRPKKIVPIPIPTVTKKYTLPLGHPEVLVAEGNLWPGIMSRLQTAAKNYGYARIETPLFEELNVFKNYFGSQDHPQVAQGYTFDAGGKQWMVRSSVHPGVLRSYFQNKVFELEPMSKWSFIGNIQKQSVKQPISEYEYGFEVLGNFTHLAEAQLLACVWALFGALELSRVVMEINFSGTLESQASYSESLKDFLRNKKYELCDTCSENLEGRVIEVLRCDKLDCQTVFADAPTILDFLDDISQKHFTSILEALDELQIPYQLNPLLGAPSGITQTVVAFKQKYDTSVRLLGTAGYHTTLIHQLAGRSWPCFGYMGLLSTLYEAVQTESIPVSAPHTSEVFLVPLGELAAKKSLRLFHDLLAAHIEVYDHFGHAGVKNQLKLAEAHKSPIALIMGQKEAADETVILRDVKSGMQEMFSYDKIVDEVKKRLGR